MTSMDSELLTQFQTLDPPQGSSGGGLTLNGILFPFNSDFHLAKDASSRPVVVIRVSSGSSVALPPVELENLRVDHYAQCQIRQPSGMEIADRFSIVQCMSDDHSLQEYFIRTMEDLARSLAPCATAITISSAIHKLAELFQALTRPPSRPVQGLWAELFILRAARHPIIMLHAWHNEAEEKFDFSLGEQRVETKCSAARERCHHFSLKQAHPSAGIRVLIASLFVEQQTNGLLLRELWDAARDLADGDTALTMKVERVCLSALGSSWDKAREKGFDEQLAKESLAFYDVADIPRVPKEQPAGVSDVHFCSDMSRARPTNIREYHNDGSLFSACPLFG